MNRLSIPISLLCCSLMLTVSCSTDTPTGGGGGEETCQGPDCPQTQPECGSGTTNTCSVGQVCRNGKCVEGSRCDRDRDCPGQEVCKRGGCYPPEDENPEEDTTAPDTTDTTDTTEDTDKSDVSVECSGCYLSSSKATCVPGNAKDNCGAGGNICKECEGDKECNEGVCETPPDCTPDNCDGCCKDGECKDGTTVNACGTGGSPCTECDGQECQGGSCTKPCSETCDGCCTDDGTCKTVQDSSFCGTDGKSCTSCGDQQTCKKGKCVDQSCSETCDGCCKNGECKGGDANTLCGTGGQSCVDCTPGRACLNGPTTCDVNSDSAWDLNIHWARMPKENNQGADWDSWSLPDPYFEVTASNGANTFKTETESSDDTINPLYPGGKTLLSDVPARALVDVKVSFVVWDDDPFPKPPTRMSDCDLIIKDDKFDGEVFKKTCEGSPISPGGTQYQVDVDLGLFLEHRN